MTCDIMIKNGLLLTMAGDLDIIENGSVLIKDSKIEQIGRTTDFAHVDAHQIIDAKGCIVMPGLVNCHTHLPMSMFRGLADDLPLDVWLNDHIFPAEAEQVNPDSVQQWSLHSIREMLLGGVTTCCDGYFHEDRVVKSMDQAGIRAIAGQGVIDFPAPGVPDPLQNIETATAFVNHTASVSKRIYPSIFCHSPYTCSQETLKAAKAAANQLGVLFQIHVAETRNEVNMIQALGDKTIIEYLDELNLLDDQTLMVHSVWIGDSDIRIIQDRGAKVAHCPESNMKLASGVCPAPKLIDAGVPVGLGTDGCASNNDLDLFGEMDSAAKLHKISLMDPCAMDARTTVKMATIEGAKALGLESRIGSIQSGKQADLIIIDTDKPHLTPLFDPYSALVYAAKSSDVDWVMVDGEILVESGQLTERR